MELLPQRCWMAAQQVSDQIHLQQALEGLGWEVVNLQAPFTAEAIKRDNCHAGIVMFSGFSAQSLRQVEALIVSSGMPCVAVVSPNCLNNHDISHIVASLCYGFVVSPGDFDDLGNLVGHAARVGSLQRKNSAADQDSSSQSAVSVEHEMVGSTQSMWALFKTIRKVAAVDTPVFISGESGTGKELTAQAIHERSSRGQRSFHAINCGALPEHLIQTELFGHEKGAFTGAAQRKIGRIEAANGGTLLLDEIGDLPLGLQVNLLRFLETRRIQRVGGLEEIPVDVRILAATHINLEQAVAEGRFREDLYHRLNVLQVEVPPLREHAEDIEILARYFFNRFCDEKPSQLQGFSREALLVMRQYHWPGNIRELINRVRRAMVMCENRLIQPEDLGIERRHLPRCVMTLEQARDAAERDTLLAALGRNHDRVLPTSRELGVSRVTIYRLLEKHGIPRNLV